MQWMCTYEGLVVNSHVQRNVLNTKRKNELNLTCLLRAFFNTT